MELFWNIPIILKIAGVFGLILLLIRRKYHLGTALLAGSALLGFWSRMNPTEILASMGAGLVQIKMLMLSAIVVLILILSRSLDKVQQMKRLLSTFQGLIKNAKFNLIVFPALIGLLPMPGGAIFSAPMVDELGNEHHLDAETKSVLNYWFRHIWEFTWPLYPGVLLAASMASISVWTFISRSFPLTVLSLATGYFFLLKNMPVNPASESLTADKDRLRRFVQELVPIIIVIIGAISGSGLLSFFQQYAPAFTAIPTELPLVLSLLLSIVYVWVKNAASGAMIRDIILDQSVVKMIYMICGIYIFKQVLVDSQAVSDLSTFLASQHIPFLLVLIVIPMLVGTIGGIAVAFIGTSFPVLISLFHTLHIEQNILPYLILGFSAGFIGVMVSPLHVCLVFTKEYFKADFHGIYRQLWKPLLTLMIGSFLYFLLLRSWIGTGL
jgi:integral membrane protein (TIGR00529 family)